MRISLTSVDLLESVLEEDVALLYKHSPTCLASASALRQIETLIDARPELSVYQVNVIEDRALSQEVEKRFGIRHESPQVILLVSGHPVWHASHYRIKASALLEKVDALRRAGEEAS